MQPSHQKLPGFTLVEVIIVVAIIGLLAAVAIPNFVHARSASPNNARINNLRHIDGAKRERSLDYKVPPAARPGIAELQPYQNTHERSSWRR